VSERILRGDEPRQRETNPAVADLAELSETAAQLLERALGVSWYEDDPNDVDLAVLALCRLRRAGAGARGSSEAGDAVVRNVLAQADAETVAWIASRAISYMDEHGFPESSDTSPDSLV
jgi:hypothetical protein